MVAQREETISKPRVLVRSATEKDLRGKKERREINFPRSKGGNVSREGEYRRSVASRRLVALDRCSLNGKHRPRTLSRGEINPNGCDKSTGVRRTCKSSIYANVALRAI